MMGRDNRSENMVVFVAREHMNERLTCRHCGQYGHDELNYYKIISYPPTWGSCGQGRGSRVGGWAKRGGKNSSGRGRGVGRETVHFVQAKNENLGSRNHSPAAHDSADFGPAASFSPTASASHNPVASHDPIATMSVPGLTQDQLQKLLSFIESPKPGFKKISGNKPWMFDSGAL